MPAAVPSVDRLLGRFQRDAAGLQLVHDVLEIFQRTRQAINAGDDKRVTGTRELEQCPEFGAAVATRAARFLGADHLAARRLERGVLDRKVLIEGRDPGVSIDRHTGASVSLATRPCPDTVSQAAFQSN